MKPTWTSRRPAAHLGRHDGAALVQRGGERLFAEHRLAGRDAGQHEIRVGFVGRGDQHRIDGRGRR